MAMSIEAGKDAPMMEINTTPLIDVLLVLLIMLIITLPIMTHAIKVEMAGDGTGEPPKTIEVAVDFDNTIVFNGEIVASLDAFEVRMREASQVRPPLHLNVRADRRAKYDSVAHVLAIARRSGIQHIAIAGTQ